MFGLASCVVQDIISLLHLIAAGSPEKSICKILNEGKVRCMMSIFVFSEKLRLLASGRAFSRPGEILASPGNALACPGKILALHFRKKCSVLAPEISLGPWNSARPGILSFVQGRRLAREDSSSSRTTRQKLQGTKTWRSEHHCQFGIRASSSGPARGNNG